MTKRKPASKGTVFCMECWEDISLDWFERMKLTGKVVHSCGRVLYVEPVKKRG